MYPSVAFHFSEEDCLVVPFAVGSVIPRSSWSHSVRISYKEEPQAAGKKLKEAMEAASALVRGALDSEHSEAAKDWERRHSEYFDTPLYGSMDLKNKRWTIYCGNDCSPQLATSLPATPNDEAAGLAVFELRQELQRLHENEG